jgi:hypothetical protein
MTLLDDYDASWKLIGVDAARGMISSAPPELLTRTGVDNLLYTVRASFSPGHHAGALNADSRSHSTRH